MKQHILSWLVAAICLLASATAQDVSVIYEVTHGPNTDTVSVYLKSKTPEPVEVMAADISIMYQGETSNFKQMRAPLTKMIKGAKVAQPSPIRLNTAMKRSGRNFTHRITYGVSNQDALIPRTAMVPAADSPEMLKAFVFIFNSRSAGTYHVETRQEFPFNQFASPSKVNVTYDVVNMGTVASVNDLISMDGSLTIYPNPTTTSLNLRMDNEEDADYQVTITDMSGRTLLTEKMPFGPNMGREHMLLVSKLPAGIYNLTAVSTKQEEQQSAVRFVKFTE
ncbi:MAG: T9SS type A sorting domain-containing protein [Bacteroidota bacterium]